MQPAESPYGQVALAPSASPHLSEAFYLQVERERADRLAAAERAERADRERAAERAAAAEREQARFALVLACGAFAAVASVACAAALRGR